MNAEVPEEYGGPGPPHPRRLPDRGGVRLGLLGHRHVADVQRPRLRPRDHRRLRGGQEGVPRDADRGAQARLVLPHRARGRLGRRLDAHPGREAGRQVRHQRVEGLHHERLARELVHGLRQDRPGQGPQGHLRLRRAARHAGRVRREEGGQARPARLGHGPDPVRGRRDPRGVPARRGEPRLQARDDDARPHAPGCRRDGASASAAPRSSSRATTPRSASSSACRSRCTRRSSS